MMFALDRVTGERIRIPALALLGAFLVSVALKLSIIGVGSPFITIDDKTAFEGGFLVWFGNAPPQRMYLESWLYGITSLSVYAIRSLAGLTSAGIGANLIADAYRDFFGRPEPYVLAYRAFTLVVDLLTAYLVYRIARLLLNDRWRGWAAVCAPAMYLFSYNTFWSGVVARPDSFLAFFCTLGVLLYLKSDFGTKWGWLLASAITLGLGAGLKLHGAFVVIFLCVDLLRVHGIASGARKALPLVLVSAFFFCFAAGSLFFDPLTYLKLRMANYDDDHSPWIRWGDQFWTLLRGSGWLTLPLAIFGGWIAFARERRVEESGKMLSIFVVVVGWILLFAMIRQMRAYWMLPALPLFYIAAVYGATRLPRRQWGVATVSLLLVVLSGQAVMQVRDLRAAQYSELRDWVVENVGSQPFYILGHDALILPKNTTCLGRTSQLLMRVIERDRAAGMPFTMRHIKNWEERSLLSLFDMLGSAYEPGYEFYDYYSAPPQLLAQITDLDEMQFLIVQDHFDLNGAPEFRDRLDIAYQFVAEKYGAGGGVQGLKYRIYQRR